MAGGNNIYSDKVVILVHIITYLFRIGLRQAVGFIKGYLEQIGRKLPVISYSQASRRFKELDIKINDRRADKNNVENIEIAIDSTNISIYSNTPNHNKKNSAERKLNRYEQVRKLHVMLDINTKKVVSTKYSNGAYSDHYGACDLLKSTNNNFKTLYADKAYDRCKLYKLCKERGIKPIIPPYVNAVERKFNYMCDRNETIKLIKMHKNHAEGVEIWKKDVNYGKRAYIEGFFWRFKCIFGFSFKNKSEVNREKEILIKCYLLNKFTEIGMPTFEMVT